MIRLFNTVFKKESGQYSCGQPQSLCIMIMLSLCTVQKATSRLLSQISDQRDRNARGRANVGRIRLCHGIACYTAVCSMHVHVCIAHVCANRCTVSRVCSPVSSCVPLVRSSSAGCATAICTCQSWPAIISNYRTLVAERCFYFRTCSRTQNSIWSQCYARST